MPVEIRLPQLADDMSVAKVGAWLKREGDAVRAGEPIVEIETDKTNVEVEAPTSGYLQRIVVPAGSDDVAVNTVLALIADERIEARTASISPASIGAFAPDPESENALKREPEGFLNGEPASTSNREAKSAMGLEPQRTLNQELEKTNREPERTLHEPERTLHESERTLHESERTLHPAPSTLNPEPHAASITPLAREIARLAGLDFSTVRPASGGRITRRDVERALDHDGPPASPAPRAPIAPAAPAAPLAHPEPEAPHSPLAAAEPAVTQATLAAPEPAAPPELAGPQAPLAVAEPPAPQAPLVAPEPAAPLVAPEPAAPLVAPEPAAPLEAPEAAAPLEAAEAAVTPEAAAAQTPLAVVEPAVPEASLVAPEPAVRQALQAPATPTEPEASAPAAPPEPSGEDVLFDVQPLTNVRRVTATRLQQVKQTIPHFYLEVECQVDALIELRSKWNARHAEAKLTVTDFVVFAASRALVQVPQANAAWAETAVRVYRSVDIAVAVNTAKGLLTPIVRGCHRKSIVTISREIGALAERARAGQLRPDEYTGATFTVSNLGMYGVTSITPIVNPPAACILGVGTIEERPVVSDGRVVPGHTMRCTLAADHRAIDGAIGAELMAALRRRLEDPLALTLEG